MSSTMSSINESVSCDAGSPSTRRSRRSSRCASRSWWCRARVRRLTAPPPTASSSTTSPTTSPPSLWASHLTVCCFHWVLVQLLLHVPRYDQRLNMSLVVTTGGVGDGPRSRLDGRTFPRQHLLRGDDNRMYSCTLIDQRPCLIVMSSVSSVTENQHVIYMCMYISICTCMYMYVHVYVHADMISRS